MIEIGRLVVKTHGHEAGRIAIVVDILDKNNVLIDGDVKRRRCNIAHLEPYTQKFDIKKGASTEEVNKLLEENELVIEKKAKTYGRKERKGSTKPKKGVHKKTATKPTKEKKKAKKSEEEIVEAALKASGA